LLRRVTQAPIPDMHPVWDADQSWQPLHLPVTVWLEVEVAIKTARHEHTVKALLPVVLTMH
jgi:hypothetical protein